MFDFNWTQLDLNRNHTQKRISLGTALRLGCENFFDRLTRERILSAMYWNLYPSHSEIWSLV